MARRARSSRSRPDDAIHPRRPRQLRPTTTPLTWPLFAVAPELYLKRRDRRRPGAVSRSRNSATRAVEAAQTRVTMLELSRPTPLRRGHGFTRKMIRRSRSRASATPHAWEGPCHRPGPAIPAMAVSQGSRTQSGKRRNAAGDVPRCEPLQAPGIKTKAATDGASCCWRFRENVGTPWSSRPSHPDPTEVARARRQRPDRSAPTVRAVSRGRELAMASPSQKARRTRPNASSHRSRRRRRRDGAMHFDAD